MNKHLAFYISFNIKPCLNNVFTETISNNNSITSRLLSSNVNITLQSSEYRHFLLAATTLSAKHFYFQQNSKPQESNQAT